MDAQMSPSTWVTDMNARRTTLITILFTNVHANLLCLRFTFALSPHPHGYLQPQNAEFELCAKLCDFHTKGSLGTFRHRTMLNPNQTEA